MSPRTSAAGLSLNAQQRAVVDRLSGDTFVSAGAGSGKTRVLAERFVALVLSVAGEDERSEALRRVLLTTFTEKAAGELGERVRRTFIEAGHPELARMVDEAWISTIHGFCARIVRRHAFELGIDPAFRVLVDPDAGVVRQQAFEDAARRAIEDDPDIAELLEIHGVADVRQAVCHGLDQVRAMGRSAADVEAERAADALPALEALLAGMAELIESYAALRPLLFVQRNLETLRVAGTLLRRVAALPRDEVPGAIVSIADQIRLTRPGRATGLERELTLEAIQGMDALILRAVDSMAARQASAFVRLVSSYAITYAERKDALAALDFEDLQLLAATVFTSHPRIAARYAERFLAVMVDEFQDTNDLQMQVLEPIAHGRLCVVGDDKQSIYGFRFADVAIFERRRTAQLALEPDGVCPLQVNYRSHPDLLATLNELFGARPFFGPEHLRLEAGRTAGWRVAVADGAPRVEVLLVDRADWQTLHWRVAEARVLARRIRKLVDGGVDPSDVVVLLRQMTAASVYIGALRREGLEVVARSSSGFFATPEIADVKALLAVISNPRDGEAVLRLLSGGLGGVSDDALYMLAARAVPPQGLWGAVRGSAAIGMSDADERRCALVVATVESFRAEQGRVRLADQLLEASAVLGPDGGCLARDGAWENIRKAARIAADLEETAQADAAALLSHLEQREAFVRAEAAAPTVAEAAAVRVMSVHAAKGLEFPVVAVADLGHEPRGGRETLLVVKDGERIRAAARLPKSYGEKLPVSTAFASARAIDVDRADEEEARVFYVACTRAEEMLILSGGCDMAKDADTSRPIDRLRRVVGSPGNGGVPGVLVEVVDAGREDELLGSAAGAVAERSPMGGDGRAQVVRPPARPLLDVPAELSYTALALFERCPFRFFAERMLRLGASGGEGEAGGPLDLGSAVHAAVQLFAEGAEPDSVRLDALARFHRLSADDRVRLEDAVRTFSGSDLVRIASTPGARTEVDFCVPMAGRMLTGTLDLLAVDDGIATIVDYKTGAADLSADAARARFERQAQVYALAALRDGHDRVRVEFVELERGGRQTVFAFAQDAAAGLEARVMALVEGIERSEFAPLPSFDHEVCADCPARGSLCGVSGGDERRVHARGR